MNKKRLFSILTKSDPDILSDLFEKIRKEHNIVIVKEPCKTLAMIKIREPVKQSLFYLGEVIVCEAIVEIEGAKGIAVTMGEDLDKILHMAVIDAAINKGVFKQMNLLLDLEKEQLNFLMKENAMHLKTMVNFESMDMEVPGDVSTH